jgi:hypothetical protein
MAITMAWKLYPTFAAAIRAATPRWKRWIPLRWRRTINVDLSTK